MQMFAIMDVKSGTEQLYNHVHSDGSLEKNTNTWHVISNISLHLIIYIPNES